MISRGALLILLNLICAGIIAGVVYFIIGAAHAIATFFSVDPSIAIAIAALAVFAVILVAICVGAVAEGRSKHTALETIEWEGADE